MGFDLTLYLVTDSGGMDDETFLAKVEAACRGGVTLLQLREKECGGREFLRLAGEGGCRSLRRAAADRRPG